MTTELLIHECMFLSLKSLLWLHGSKAQSSEPAMALTFDQVMTVMTCEKKLTNRNFSDTCFQWLRTVDAHPLCDCDPLANQILGCVFEDSSHMY